MIMKTQITTSIALLILVGTVAPVLANIQGNDFEDDFFQGYSNGNQLEPDFDELPNEMQQNIETNLTELEQAHVDLSNIMMIQNESTLYDYTGPDIPFTMVYIDDDTLVVGIDPLATYLPFEIEPELIQHILGIDAPVEVQYVSFLPEASTAQIQSWKTGYASKCMPVTPGYDRICRAWSSNLRSVGETVPTTTNTNVNPTQTSTTATNNNPCDTNSKSTTCYYYKLYEQRCTDGKTYKRCGTYESIIQRAGFTVPSSGDTNMPQTPTVIPTYELTNINAVKKDDSIKVTWDKPTSFKVKYYKIYVSENEGRDSYKGKISNPNTTYYTLSDIEEGSSYKFKIKLYYYNERGSSSVKYFYSNVVNVPVTIPTCTSSEILRNNVCVPVFVDRTPPVITVPEDIVVNATSNTGIAVDYKVSATDETDGDVTVTCSKSSGVDFIVGSTIVTCQATDEAGNTSTVSFNVIVEFIRSIIDWFTPPVTKYYGGNDFYLLSERGDLISEVPSTVTIGATHNNGQEGFVIAGHGVSIPQGFTFTSSNVTDGIVSTDRPNRIYGGNVDAAFVRITEPNVEIPTDQIQALNGTIIDVSDGRLSDIPLGESLHIYGKYNNGDGLFFAKNATLHDRGVLFINMGIALYPSQGGDSGAPIIFQGEQTNSIVGVHKGGLCIFDSIFEGQPFVNVTGTSYCDFDAEPKNRFYYKTFSAWENVKDALDLQ